MYTSLKAGIPPPPDIRKKILVTWVHFNTKNNIYAIREGSRTFLMPVPNLRCRCQAHILPDMIFQTLISLVCKTFS